MSVPKSDQILNIAEASKMKPSGAAIQKWVVKNWPAVFGEYVAVVLLVLFGCMSCLPVHGSDTLPPMYTAFGFGLIVLYLVTVFGNISGAYLNPSVTTAAMISGEITPYIAVAYYVAEITGAITGYALLILLSPIDVVGREVCVLVPYAGHHPFYSILIELILTMSLVFLCCSQWDPTNAAFTESGSMKFGLSVAGFSIAAGQLTGASVNPARSLAPAIFTGVWRAQYVYWVGPLTGAVLAAYLYKFVWRNMHNSTAT